jgi:hypothetical protein
MDQKLRMMGHNAALEFNQKLIQNMQTQEVYGQ